MLIDLKDELSSDQPESFMGDFWQVLLDIPLAEVPVFTCRLFDSTVVVFVLEQQNFPSLDHVDVNVREKIFFFDVLNDKVNLRLSVVEVSLLGEDPDLMERSVNNLAPKLLKSPEQKIKVLGHELVHKLMQQWIVHFRRLW